MSDHRRVELTLTPTAFGSVVKIDGVEVPNVRSLGVECDLENGTVVTLRLVGADVEVEASVEVDKIRFENPDGDLS